MRGRTHARTQVSVGRAEMTLAVTRYMQYIFRIHRKTIKENFQLRATLKKEFWNRVHSFHVNYLHGLSLSLHSFARQRARALPPPTPP
jgi:hypothetical protein